KDILCVAFSPDGRLLASQGQDNAVRLWNVNTGQVLKTLSGVGHGGLQTLAFSPDGRMLATADWTGMIGIWDIESGEKLAEPNDPSLDRAICSIAFSPDGRYFAAGGADRGGVTLWRIKPGAVIQEGSARLEMQRIASRPSERAGAWSLAFSPDSNL